MELRGIRIERATGEGTVIGSLKFQSIQPLAFDGSGRLLVFDAHRPIGRD